MEVGRAVIANKPADNPVLHGQVCLSEAASESVKTAVSIALPRPFGSSSLKLPTVLINDSGALAAGGVPQACAIGEHLLRVFLGAAWDQRGERRPPFPGARRMSGLKS